MECVDVTLHFCLVIEQVGQLSQAICAAACTSFSKNISAKSMHLTSLYPTALTSTNDHLTVYVTMFVLNAKLCSIYALILEVFGGLNLVSLSVFLFFLLKKSWLIFNSPVATTLRPTGSLIHVL